MNPSLPSTDPVLWPSDPNERERAYSPSSCVDDIAPFLNAYAAESARVRGMIPPETVRYSSQPRSEFDVFAAGTDRVHCFIHGGYWQQLSKDDASFPAEQFVAAGITYIALGYQLCPDATFNELIGQVRTGVQRIRNDYPDSHLTLSGSSAGAHLAVMASYAVAVDQLVLLSGIYDLRPLVDTYVNDALELSVREAWRLSPLRNEPPVASAVVMWGENETAAFKRQSELFASLLGVSGIEVAGRNHFDIVHDLFDLSERH